MPENSPQAPLERGAGTFTMKTKTVRAVPPGVLALPSAGTPAYLFFLAIIFWVLLFSRRPDVLLHAELCGEEGWFWYPQAYTRGLASLLIPEGGYLQSFSRLVAIAAQLVPLHTVPTIFAAVGLTVQVAPALFLVSNRMALAWPNPIARLLFAVLLLSLPNAFEVYGNLTDAHWHLALLAFLVLVSSPPAGWIGKLLDILVLLVSGLSGPFSILLIPVALWQAIEQRRPIDLWRLGVLSATALVQIGFILGSSDSRSTAPLAAGPRMLARIVALQILIGPELGYRSMDSILRSPFWQNNVLPLAVAAAGTAITAACLLKGPRLLRQFALFAALVFAAGLARPQVSLTQPQWPLMALPLHGTRYFVYPMLVWVGVLFLLVSRRGWFARIPGIALLALMAVWAIPGDWHGLDLPPSDFVARARAFEAAAPGTRMEFPVYPPFGPMILVKKAD